MLVIDNLAFLNSTPKRWSNAQGSWLIWTETGSRKGLSILSTSVLFQLPWITKLVSTRSIKSKQWLCSAQLDHTIPKVSFQLSSTAILKLSEHGHLVSEIKKLEGTTLQQLRHSVKELSNTIAIKSCGFCMIMLPRSEQWTCWCTGRMRMAKMKWSRRLSMARFCQESRDDPYSRWWGNLASSKSVRNHLRSSRSSKPLKKTDYTKFSDAAPLLSSLPSANSLTKIKYMKFPLIKMSEQAN